jgi:anti-sigma factor RsiW
MARIIPLDSDEHHVVQSLLPWYANGTLEPAEADRVRAHLAECERCQADAQWQDRLREGAAVQDLVLRSSVNQQWAALYRRITAHEPQPSPLPKAIAAWFRSRWMPLAIGVEGAMVLVLAVALAWVGALPREEAYRTLGAAPVAATANALVVFRPNATEAEIRRVLRANRALLVGGPTVTDAWLVHLSTLSGDTLSRLRADTAVLRVESLEGDAR